MKNVLLEKVSEINEVEDFNTTTSTPPFKWIERDIIQGRKFYEPGEEDAPQSMIGRSNTKEWYIVWGDGLVSKPLTTYQLLNSLNRAHATPSNMMNLAPCKISKTRSQIL